MLDFINTSLFKKGEQIAVIVYSDSRNKIVDKIEQLVDGENIIKQKESYAEKSVLVEKDGINILVKGLPLSQSTRGYRCTYSFVDTNIFNLRFGQEIFNQVIRPANIVYSHLLNDTENKPNISIMLF